MTPSIRRALFVLAVTLALAVALASAGCGSAINSEGPWERTVSAFQRARGTTGADAGLVLTSPAAISPASLEQEVLLYSPARGAVTTVRFAASDAARVRGAIDAGTLLTVTAASPLPETAGRQTVLATAWKATNEFPDPYYAAIFRDLDVVLQTVRPAAPPVTQIVALSAPTPPPERIYEVVQDESCRGVLAEYHAGAVASRRELEGAGVPREFMEGLYADQEVRTYLEELP